MNFKRLLKPILVILAILILTLSVSAGDLYSTYDKRIKLTVDHTKIDADLSWFPVTVFLGYGDIDVGAEAIDRDYTIAARTFINKTNPANASGKITSVEIYASSNMTGAIVATFYRPDPTEQPNYLVARDNYEIGSVTAGSKQTFTVELDVEVGDYLGIYYSSGTIEGDAGSGGIWQYFGNATGTTGTTFTLHAYVISLYATGFIGHGEEVFTEFDADEDFDRIAFTSSDGETQLYADCELFDDSEQKAIYHVSKTGWTVSSSADTDIYLYYDNTADHNTTYISKSGGTAAQSVWDSNFKAVYHMADNTTSTIVDSTSNNNDGTKKGANEPAEATGKVGQGQDFDGKNDYIDTGYQHSTAAGTFLSIVRFDDFTDFKWMGADTTRRFYMGTYNQSYLIGGFGNTSNFSVAHGYNPTETHLLTLTGDGSKFSVYSDGVEKISNISYGWTAGNSTNIYLGARNAGTVNGFIDGVVDETRISSTARSAAWIAATYDSLWDTLLTYGSEETAPTGEATNVLFIFSNF